MEVYAYKVVMKKKGTLTITDLPLNAGDSVEVIIIPREDNEVKGSAYPFWGQPITFDNPTGPVADNDWELLA